MRRIEYILLLTVLVVSACDKTAQESKQPLAQDTAAQGQLANEGADSASGGSDSPSEATNKTPEESRVMTTMLVFEESESNSEPYFTRMLVSKSYIRIDEGDGSDGYVLFDRDKNRIFSVLHDNEQILIVDPATPYQAAPDSLKLHTESSIDGDAPEVNGIKPTHYKYFANDTLCYNVIALDGFLPEVNAALIEYQTVLARQQQATVETTPEELRTPCFISNYLYSPVSHVSQGFPFEKWDVEGYRRTLVDFAENHEVDRKVFALPEGYGFFTLGGDGGTIM